MDFILKPWQIMLVVIAGWIHREQQKTIEFYQAQLQALMEAQGTQRLLVTDEHRRLLAVKGKSSSRSASSRSPVSRLRRSERPAKRLYYRIPRLV